MKSLLRTLFIIGISTLIKVQFTSQDDQYSDDDNKPYEFSFTIENEQHRYEKKDVNGIIEGEFGFITGDGVYHVSVYATDQSGSFKILSMKNVKISEPLDQLADGIKSIQKSNIQEYGGRAVLTPEINRKFEPTTSKTFIPLTPPARTTYKIKTVSTIRPGCGGCGIVAKKTTPSPDQFGKYKEPERDPFAKTNNVYELPPIKNAIKSSFGIGLTSKPSSFTSNAAITNLAKANVQKSIPTVRTYTPSVNKEVPKSFFTVVYTPPEVKKIDSIPSNVPSTLFTSNRRQSFSTLNKNEAPKTFTLSKPAVNELAIKSQKFFTSSNEVQAKPPQTFFTSNKKAVVSQTHFGSKTPALLDTTNTKLNDEPKSVFTSSKQSSFNPSLNSPPAYKPTQFFKANVKSNNEPSTYNQPSVKTNYQPETYFTSSKPINAPSGYQKITPQVSNQPVTFSQPISVKLNYQPETHFTSSKPNTFSAPSAYQTSLPQVSNRPVTYNQPSVKPNYQPETSVTPGKPFTFNTPSVYQTNAPQVSHKPITFNQPNIKPNYQPETHYTSSKPTTFNAPSVYQTSSPQVSHKPITFNQASVKSNYQPDTSVTSGKPATFNTPSVYQTSSPQVSHKPITFNQPNIKPNYQPETHYTSSKPTTFNAPSVYQTSSPQVSHKPITFNQASVKSNYQPDTSVTSGKPATFNTPSVYQTSSPQVSHKPITFNQPNIKPNYQPETHYTSSKPTTFNAPSVYQTSSPQVSHKPITFNQASVKSNYQPDTSVTSGKPATFNTPSVYQTSSPQVSHKPITFNQPNIKPNYQPETHYTSSKPTTFNAPSVYQTSSPQVSHKPITFNQASVKSNYQPDTSVTSGKPATFNTPSVYQTSSPQVSHKPITFNQPNIKPNYQPETHYTSSKPTTFNAPNVYQTSSPQVSHKPITFNQASVKSNYQPDTSVTSGKPATFNTPSVYQTSSPQVSHKPITFNQPNIKPNYQPETHYTSSKPSTFNAPSVYQTSLPQISNKPVTFSQPSIKIDEPRTLFTSSIPKQFDLPVFTKTNAPPLSFKPAEINQLSAKPINEPQSFFTPSKTSYKPPAINQPSIRPNNEPKTFFTSSKPAQVNSPTVYQTKLPQTTERVAPIQFVFTTNRPTSFTANYAKDDKPTVFNTHNVPQTNYPKVISSTRKSTSSNIPKTGTINNLMQFEPLEINTTLKTISTTNTQVLDSSRNNSPHRLSIVRKSSSRNIPRKDRVTLDNSINTPRVTTLIPPPASSYHILSKKSTYSPVETTSLFPILLKDHDSVSTSKDINPSKSKWLPHLPIIHSNKPKSNDLLITRTLNTTSANDKPRVHNTRGTTTNKTKTDTNSNQLDSPLTNYRQPVQNQNRGNYAKPLQLSSPVVKAENGNIYVPGNEPIPIKDKYPNMHDGLPNGITIGDIIGLLYQFNYTVGFHGHYETGWSNGTKIGGYFINGRDGYSRVVTYVADENGFRPKYRLINLGIDSKDTPKPESEKTFGLKSFEFVWHPIQ